MNFVYLVPDVHDVIFNNYLDVFSDYKAFLFVNKHFNLYVQRTSMFIKWKKLHNMVRKDDRAVYLSLLGNPLNFCIYDDPYCTYLKFAAETLADEEFYNYVIRYVQTQHRVSLDKWIESLKQSCVLSNIDAVKNDKIISKVRTKGIPIKKIYDFYFRKNHYLEIKCQKITFNDKGQYNKQKYTKSNCKKYSPNYVYVKSCKNYR